MFLFRLIDPMDGSLRGLEILLVEDEPLWRRELVAFLEEAGAEVIAVETIEAVRNCLAQANFDLILADIHLPDGESLELLRAGELKAALGVIVMTAEGGVERAVEAMRLGAADYLSKPFEPEELFLVFARLRRSRQAERIDQHERQRKAAEQGGFFFGEALAGLRQQLERVLETDRRLGSQLPPVLLQGETGTGKSSLARWIHEHGPRAAEPFVEINCAALPDALAESELFGHEKGAFTDARTDRLGLFEAAHGGTLFLDEIGSLSGATQAKILTAIELHKIRRVGGRKEIAVDVRLIAAALDDLPTAVREGRFREDLYHRLNLLAFELPPLRDRGGDLEALAQFLLERLKKKYRRPRARLAAPMLRVLRTRPWPGNIRELAHELERALIFSNEDELTLAGTPPGGAVSKADGGAETLLNPVWELPAEGFDLTQAMQELESKLIREALRMCDDNVSAAARQLGVPRDFIRYRQKSERAET